MIFHKFNIDKFAEEVRRMCNEIGCGECPLKSETLAVCRFVKSEDRLNKILKGVYDWSLKNPPATNFDKFKEVFGDKFASPPPCYSGWWQSEFKQSE